MKRLLMTLVLSVAAPAFGQSALTGTLERLYFDYSTSSEEKLFLRTDTGERLALRFPNGIPPGQLKHGQKITVKGKKRSPTITESLDGRSGVVEEADVQALNAPLGQSTFGAQKTLLLLVSMTNAPANTSLATAQSVMASVSNWDLPASYQQTWLVPTIVPVSIPMSTTGCDYYTLASMARQAAINAGVPVSTYQRLGFAFPQTGCTFWGLGTVGLDYGNTNFASEFWINGAFSRKVVGHEMGHNFGLKHAHSCSWTSTGCSGISDYGDPVDMMGLSGEGQFTAFGKDRLGWLNFGTSPSAMTVTGSGTYQVEPLDTASGNKGLKIPWLSDASQAFWVDYRSGSASPVIYYGTTYDGYYLQALSPGATFSDARAGVWIRNVGASGSGVKVEVGIGSAPPVTPPPPTPPTKPPKGHGHQ